MRHVTLVAIRDFRERITSRAFQVSTGLTLLLVAAFILLPSILGGDDGQTWTVGTVGSPPPQLKPAIELAAADPDTVVEISEFDDVAQIEQALRDREIDAGYTQGAIYSIGQDSPDELLALLIAVGGTLELADRAASLGLSQSEVDELLRQNLEVIELSDEPADSGAGDEGSTGNRTFAFFGVIFLFISIVTYGQWILIGVIEEKSSRVVEVVLGAVRPHHLLAGKVLGIGVLGLGQLIVVGLVALALIQQSSTFTLPSAAATAAIAVVVWFLLGFAFYATAYAATGSLVSRQEEAQNAAFPLTMVLMAGYFIASFSFTGDNPALRIASLVPATAPMTMPLRMAAGDAALWEIVLSFSLMVVVTWLLIRFAGRVYAGGLLRSAGRIKIRDAWRSAEG
ncbi:MAG: ABC transporter permease [Acidimicrobiia bacterium]|nr:ABC transporter permease [Acidimicrobiia bacterium]